MNETEEAARRILEYWEPDYGNEDEVIVAHAYLSLRASTVEECAKVADEWKDRADRLLTGDAADRAYQASQAIAARIRSLAGKGET